MSDIKLGILITTEQFRDAIHVAIAPVTSKDKVYPGQHLALVEGSTTEVTSGARSNVMPIGIVDPFLTEPVKPGETFWLCLYPQTVTSLRHAWCHPAFAFADTEKPGAPESASNDVSTAKADAKLALGVLAECFGCSFEALIERLGYYADGSCGDDDNIQEGLNQLDEFAVRNMWANYEAVSGARVSDDIKGDTYFRCAC